MRRPALGRRALDERGSSLVEGLLALSLVVAVFGIGVELLLAVQARTVALAAAQAGARAAALGGEPAGLAAAREVLAAGGGLARGLAASLVEEGDTVTVTVAGAAPAPFRLGVVLPAVDAAATVTVERYPAGEQAAGP